ncbi:MAG: KGK family protein [Microcoleus sp. PH2017_10_PVI_O_A]|uniref:KGK domain-containing protein n=1 Tax=unclassified Microcoleus TaxID=2642155 RepID=UPI001D442610|nr:MULTISPECIES: KGK domain-containing protein [unclassified Microcoleus]TAE75235.1 MAG: KGK family protein [Oscillatoriales cyanobacterium]MCC3409491.1 KGK family protein [Microcoleus sp. PH2017_10_PVI_O_A]MCC3464209.1 KGK family protein [Microcoleus sp. PH2017_11_PCY_U_A]MCC3482552.1 KGK family protein [Microcoleus sp. PH2017_12_PCY_D_A]MCC3563545.1 KGK family protein [Microcoleus sp. PH2017_27_LUM_O_A]
MSENIEANQRYEKLEGANDVLLLNYQATFTVGKFKELVAAKFNEILVLDAATQSRRDSINGWMQRLWISEETSTIISGGDINWNSPKEGIDCQVLKIGSKGWQKGKMKIEVNKSFEPYGKTRVCIKFCPDEALEEKSPLDDIRQSEEYKKLSNNN